MRFESFRPLLRLVPYVRPYRWHLGGALVLAIPLAAIRFAPVPFVKYIVDDLLVSRNPAKLTLFPILFVLLFVINFVVRFVHYYLIRVVVARVGQKLKQDLFDHLTQLSADYFSSQRAGELISRVGNDPQLIDAGIASLNILVREPATFLFLIAATLKLNWKLTLITFVIFPPLGWVFSMTGKNLKRYIGRMNEQNADVFSVLQESFAGMRIVQMFQLEPMVRQQFQKSITGFARFSLKMAALEEAAHPMVELLTSFAIAAVLYVGGSQVLAGEMSSGDLLSFFTAFALMMNPLRTISDMNIKFHSAAAAAHRVFQVFDWKSHIVENPVAKPVSQDPAEIVFDRVSFAYPEMLERPVLKSISFRVKRNQVVALVGPSGAGKSSIASLLPRIYDVTGGSITIDGVDLREARLEQLRSRIAVVSQDVFLFNDTIEANIRCGRPDATFEEIREAAKQAHALEFIERLPQGFASRIGDRGQKLSGGERQRLSIARAFLRRAPLLVLDEATSNLDAASEALIQESLRTLMMNRTTLVIAHRLSTIQSADEILVVRAGEIVERGQHSELLARAGEYARLYGVGE